MSRHSPKEIERIKRIAAKMDFVPGEAKAHSLDRLVRPRFFRKQFARGRYHIYDREDSETVPIYDGAPYGNDKPIIMDDDTSAEWVERPNTKLSDGE